MFPEFLMRCRLSAAITFMSQSSILCLSGSAFSEVLDELPARVLSVFTANGFLPSIWRRVN